MPVPDSDAVSGQVQVAFNALTTSIAYIRTGKVRPLAKGTAQTIASCGSHAVIVEHQIGRCDRLLKITARPHPVELRFVADCRLVPPNPSGPKSGFALQLRELKP